MTNSIFHKKLRRTLCCFILFLYIILHFLQKLAHQKNLNFYNFNIFQAESNFRTQYSSHITCVFLRYTSSSNVVFLFRNPFLSGNLPKVKTELQCTSAILTNRENIIFMVGMCCVTSSRRSLYICRLVACRVRSSVWRRGSKYLGKVTHRQKKKKKKLN